MKKGIIAAVLAILLGVGAFQLINAQDNTKSCCPRHGTPECNPPATCCCVK
ncbi:MAG: hypothetical protein HY707_03485 [Ignavibacteriae bacterium]|nr:hypothetical protein [Ignavibacteriota bacterium]